MEYAIQERPDFQWHCGTSKSYSPRRILSKGLIPKATWKVPCFSQNILTSEPLEIQASGIHGMGFHRFGSVQGSQWGTNSLRVMNEGHEPDGPGSRTRRFLFLASFHLRECLQAMPLEPVHSVSSNQHCQPFVPDIVLVFNPPYRLASSPEKTWKVGESYQNEFKNQP